jgi:beta-ureidopropionase / N-carbamoyl-L-amino-acid hydrolase
MAFEEMWEALRPIGRAGGGGYRRFSWTAADRECRDWFAQEARSRGLALDQDRNGNLLAWWDVEPGPGAGAADMVAGGVTGDAMAGRMRRDAVLTGSHLDSVPDGGAYDGPLGVVSALAAIDLLRERGVAPRRPLGVAVFTEEEGARFGVACLGSRLVTGAIDPSRARGLRDADGVTWAAAMEAEGYDPELIGPDPDLLSINCYVELHVEQGRALNAPVGVASAIWPHGRWRFDFTGEGNHAGTTLLGDRRDPMLPFARTVLAARDAAEHNDAVATMGKVRITPNGVNAIPSSVQAWLDARAPSEAAVRATVARTLSAAEEAAGWDGVEVALTEESYTEVVEFHTALRDRLVKTLGDPPVLPTGAGHDAGILSLALVETAMLFVRNPTGVSHSPEEFAEEADCISGVVALARVVRELAS